MRTRILTESTQDGKPAYLCVDYSLFQLECSYRYENSAWIDSHGTNFLFNLFNVNNLRFICDEHDANWKDIYPTAANVKTLRLFAEQLWR